MSRRRGARSPGAGPSRGLAAVARGRARAGTLLMAVVVAVVATATLQFKHVGERGVKAERDLQRVVTELQVQDALEWRAISGRVPPDDVHEHLVASRRRARALLTRALQGDPHRADRISVLRDHYSGVVDEELRLLGAGRVEEAVVFDESEVDPAFQTALGALEQQGTRISAVALRARTLSDVGVVLSVALSLALTALVQGRRRRADVQRRAERRTEARHRALVDQSADLVVTDRSGCVSYLSPSAERLLGWREAPAGTRLDVASAAHPDDRALLVEALATAVPGSGAQAEVRLRGADRWRTFEVSVQDLRADPAVGGLVLTGHDVTDRLVLQQELEHRALHDALTGLPNRALLADRFEQALRAAQRLGAPVGLLLIDLDRFKEVNDTLGHHYGDQLLVQVGPRLSGVLRDSDTVARLGGDEFAVLLPHVRSVEAATEVAEALQEALRRPFPVDGVDLDVEASIGVVLSGDHGQDATTLMQRADIAMYVAKQRNLGVFSYDPALDSHSPEKLSLLGDLRRALDHDELLLHYQPKVSLSTGEVCGAEALVRWQHPSRGIVPPDAFIPLAENTGLIGPLTHRVLDLALAQARRWADQVHPLQVAVNLSARNLLDERLDTLVSGLLTAHGVAAHLLQLEVTESAIMSDPVRAKDLLGRLDALGVDISIDDFGAGYTSLGQLKDLPVTELKVDRSFVATMHSDTSNALIVRSVIELGHNLGLSTVAEGVEDAGAVGELTGYSCDVAQGYHVSRPLPVHDFDPWRAAWAGFPDPAAVTAAVTAARNADHLAASAARHRPGAPPAPGTPS